MGRKPKVQRSAEEKYAIVMDGLKSGKYPRPAASTRSVLPCFTAGNEMEKGSLAALWAKSAAAPADEEQGKRIKQLKRAMGRSHLEIEILKKPVGRVSCGQAHSQARQFVAQGGQGKLVAETIGISRSSLYYQPKPRASRADGSQDKVIIVACGDKPAYGYRRVAWWLRRKQGLTVNGKRVLRVMRGRNLPVTPPRLRARPKKEWGRAMAEAPNQVWQSDMTKVWAGANVGWAYLVSVIDGIQLFYCPVAHISPPSLRRSFVVG